MFYVMCSMLTTIKTCAVIGLDCESIEVEVDIARGKGFFAIVGLPDKSIKEAEQRLRAAIKNCHINFPITRRLIINLAPADIQKMGSAYDLPMAVGIILAVLELTVDLKDSLFIGELSLEGTLRHTNGILPIALYAKNKGIKTLYLPKVNLAEASLIKGLKIIPLDNLNQLIHHLTDQEKIKPILTQGITDINNKPEILFDIANIKGQQQAKRALEIAAAGGHNLLLNGPPGSGKTLLAKALPSILPPLTTEEILEVTKIYSVAGMLPSQQPIVGERPFRAPHHSSSGAALIGGGRIPTPGEISLAHRGVLFLDEFAEFPRQVLENLRQPLEDGIVTVSRAAGSLTFPARFTLVASKNPCPCGFATDLEKQCICTPNQINNYNRKISGPLLDRIDLQVEVPRVKFEKLHENNQEETSSIVRERVIIARQRQNKRFKNLPWITNSEMDPKTIQEFCPIDNQSSQLLQSAMAQLQLSARAYHRILKVARTIADLAGEKNIKAEQIAEALQYRGR